jgi:predicted acylesterase/phospholipase RssA
MAITANADPSGLRERLKALETRRQRRLLALDGGGIRGIISIEVLAKIEDVLRKNSGNPELVLADYFDYIAGTSTGAVIGTLVSLGYPVEEIRKIYLDCGRMMFDKGAILNRMKQLGVPWQKQAETASGMLRATWSYVTNAASKAVAALAEDDTGRKAIENALSDAYAKYPDKPLVDKLHQLIGADDVTLGTDKLRTLLLLVLSNATTDSPWPVSNNPQAKYNKPYRDNGTPREDWNLQIPLWKLVRASTAAPTYFPPESVPLGSKTMVFVDGGVTSYNNPAFQLFLQATLEPYNLGWKTGEKEMLLVSVGTGVNPHEMPGLTRADMQAITSATTAAGALFSAAMYQQDLMCRAFGRCLEGSYELDREVGTMVDAGGPVADKLFTYVRYNAQITQPWMADHLGLPDIKPENVKMLDSVDYMTDLRAIGTAIGDRFVKPEHFAAFPPELVQPSDQRAA